MKLLIGCTGSVATIKLPVLLTELHSLNIEGLEIRVIITERATHFISAEEISSMNIQLYRDADEWQAWSQRGDPVLHIDLAKWADLFIIAPLDANTLGKIANGLCDNLLTCIARAWDFKKPFLICPAMNTRMWEHPVTERQIGLLQSWGCSLVPCIAKVLICGDTGLGAMAEVLTIIEKLKSFMYNSNVLSN